MFDSKCVLVYKRGIRNLCMRTVAITIFSASFLIIGGAAVFGLQAKNDSSQGHHLPDQGPGEELANNQLEKRSRPIKWPLLDGKGASVRSMLSEQLQKDVDSAPLPVLVPAEVSSLTMKIRHTSHSLTITAQSEESSFVLYGTRIEYSLPQPEVASNQSHGRQSAIISGDEGVWTATWNEYGVAYMLRLGCADSAEECESDIRNKIDSLTFVGGRP